MENDIARLARHLSARLEELESACVLVRGWASAADGRVEARFPGRDAVVLRDRLAACPVVCRAGAGDTLVFWLTADTPFEALDTVWGLLYESLS